MKKSIFLLFLPALVLAGCVGNDNSASENSKAPVSTPVGGNSTLPESFVSGSDAQEAKDALMNKVMASMQTLDWDSFKVAASLDANGLLSFMADENTFVTLSNMDISLNFELMASLNSEILGSLDFETLVGDEDLAKLSLVGNANFSLDSLTIDEEGNEYGGNVTGSFDGKITYGRQSLKAPGMEEAKESDWLFANYSFEMSALENGAEESEEEKQSMTLLSDDILPSYLEFVGGSMDDEYYSVAEFDDDDYYEEDDDPMMMLLAMIYESASIAEVDNTYFLKVELKDVFDMLFASEEGVMPTSNVEMASPVIEGSIVAKFAFNEEDALREVALSLEDAKVAYGNFIDLELSFAFLAAKTEEKVVLVTQAEIDALGENVAYVPGEYLFESMVPDYPSDDYPEYEF